MKEVEVKILEIDRKKVESRLISLGAKKVYEKELFANYYDDGKIKDKGIMLRVRKEGDKTVLTVKSKVSKEKSKIVDEYEVEVSDFETVCKQIELLGHKKYLGIRKRRIQYELDNVHFAIDKYLDEWSIVPEFMEIEAQDEKTVFEFAKKLGFDEKDCKPWSGKDVFKYYSAKHS